MLTNFRQSYLKIANRWDVVKMMCGTGEAGHCVGLRSCSIKHMGLILDHGSSSIRAATYKRLRVGCVTGDGEELQT
jgi:hypothetical protein